ncbi:hypothetical protein Q7C_1129 [Methylophaga frappieri]|uniref:DUF2157 domain-containing protein n=1 Tax=Methylophaga frappieri (strain ATCC BAA-2434 / DSM 25690 / JAM7) TaxID=754477 RepID=I1YH91_METFJ|nr:hypothetical protein [Methylophaga frappieri]AFJ02284.1 hypothetical protein Q7C_1129 [Methylophaga frappieri]
MKVTLDLEQLLRDGQISEAEYQKLYRLAAASTGALAFNVLIGFGVIAVSSAALAMMPTVQAALIIGLLTLISGLVLLRSGQEQWRLLANICMLVGVLMAGGGLLAAFNGSLVAILAVTGLLALISIFAKSSLLAVLGTLMLSASIGARTGYYHASYFLVIQEPTLTILLFSALAIGLYLCSKKLTTDYENLAIVSARTSVFLVNFGFWIGSLWGERAESEIIIPAGVFSGLWAMAIMLTAIWAWRRNRRWVFNTVVVFGGIHFYTQWFEYLGASAATVLMAGLLALAMAVGLHSVNTSMKQAMDNEANTTH